MNKFVAELQSMIHHFTFQEKHYLLVGPVNLPISIEHEEVQFTWYAFASVEADTTPTVESIVQMSTEQQTFSSCLLLATLKMKCRRLCEFIVSAKQGMCLGH